MFIYLTKNTILLLFSIIISVAFVACRNTGLDYNDIGKEDRVYVAFDVVLGFTGGISDEDRMAVQKHLSSAEWLFVRHTRQPGKHLIINKLPEVSKLHTGMGSREVFMLLGKATEVAGKDLIFLLNTETPLRNMGEYPWGWRDIGDGRTIYSLQAGYTRTICMWSLAVVDKVSGKCQVLDVEIGFEFDDITKIDAYSNPYIAGRDDGWSVYWYMYKCQIVDIEDVITVRGLENLHGVPITTESSE
jgi:hypothetical protein